jgi:hypothetical protein
MALKLGKSLNLHGCSIISLLNVTKALEPNADIGFNTSQNKALNLAG